MTVFIKDRDQSEEPEKWIGPTLALGLGYFFHVKYPFKVWVVNLLMFVAFWTSPGLVLRLVAALSQHF